MTGKHSLTYQGMVYPWHCDHMGHMNVMWYAGKFDEATWHHFASIGISTEYLRNNDLGMAAVDQHIVYKAELSIAPVEAITPVRIFTFCFL